MNHVFPTPPSRQPCLAEVYKGGVSVHPVRLCMWSSRVSLQSEVKGKLQAQDKARGKSSKITLQEKNATSYDERQGYIRDRQSPILNLATAIMGADQRNTPQDKTKLKRRKKQARNLSQSFIHPDLENMNSELDWSPSLEHQACLHVQLSIVQL